MARKIRLDPTDGWHHVMNRGVDRQRIFFDDEDRTEFGRCVALACRRFGIELHAYCLMDNHFHLLVKCPESNLSEMMHLACGLYARHVNGRHQRVGHLFGGRFCSRLVTSTRYVVNAVRYIHRNPFDIAGVIDPGSYRWSSHGVYVGARRAADFMRTDVVLAWFDSPAEFDAFVGIPIDSARARGLDPARLDTDVIMQAVDLVIDERSQLRGRAVLSQRRAIALEIAGLGGTQARQRLLNDLGSHSHAAQRSAIIRATKHLESEQETPTLIAQVLGLLAPGADLDIAA